MSLFRTITVCAAAALSLAVSARGPINEKEIPAILGRLSLEQKARLVTGTAASTAAPSHFTPGSAGWTYAIEEYGIPGLNLADGPVGPRINPMPWIATRVVYDENGLPYDAVTGNDSEPDSTQAQWCTAFASTASLAASFDPAAARLQGEIMGDECRVYGVDMLLTPGINIVRNPLCGRNFEYFSEDPVLTGIMAAELVKGVQSQGVGTSLKHFVANNQQTGKKYNDARISQRALREIYLRAFERVIRQAKPWAVMTSYNKIGGTYTQTNPELLIDLLRKEWGYNGLVVTDWTVYRPTDSLIAARTGLIMPGSEKIVTEIIEGVKNGKIKESDLDVCVADVLRLAARSLSANGWEKGTADLAGHSAISRRLAAESMVLLKNNDNLLPLEKGRKIALFGTGAYQSIAGGTGSSNVNKRFVIDIDRGLEAAGYEINEEVRDIYSTYIEAQAALTDNHPECPEWQKISYFRPIIDEMDLAKADNFVKRQARTDDAAVIVISRKSGETADRVVDNDFNLSAAEHTMLRTVSEAFHKRGKPVVVVLNVPGNMEIASWRDMADAIVVAWYPGQECGNAVADVLSGTVAPSGRLPFTIPLHYTDLPSSRNFPFLGQTEGRNFDYTNYEEDIWVGYRYFDKSGREVAYPFGYGLSYTTFDYSPVTISRKGATTTVSTTVTNTGTRPGREVVQLYISAPEVGLIKPAAELKGFAKTRSLAPGESERVTIAVTDDELASFDEANSQWVTAKGTYQARLGRHVGNYIASAPFEIKKDKIRKVANILAPVKPVKAITPAPDALASMSWHPGTDFRILGRCYPDSLPVYSRVPAFLKPTTREELYKLGSHSAGIAIRFRSNSPRIALRWHNIYGNSMSHMADLATRGADLYFLTPDSTWRYLAPAMPYTNPCTSLIIDNMDPEMHEYMLHLPLYDGVDSLEIGIADGSEIAAPAVDSPRASRKPVVIYGTSIAHGATASRPGMAASNILRRELNCETINLGFSANAHIDYEIARMMADVDASVYILDFVPNAFVPEIEEKTEEFVRILRSRRPDVPLIFIETPDFTYTQLDKKSYDYYHTKNLAIKAVYERLRAQGLENTWYISADEIVPADGDGSSDSIHFTDQAYRSYCDRLLPILRDIVK